LTSLGGIVIKRQDTIHNHPVHEGLWYEYAEHRKVIDPAIVNMVEHFVSAKASFRKIVEFVAKESGM
jgi:hypothetical protein